MRKLILLLKIQWHEIMRFQFIQSDHPGMQKILVIVLGMLGITYLGGYCYLMAVLLVPLNLTLMLPGALLAMLSFLFILMNIFKADEILIHPKDENILQPLPIPHTTVILSRLIALYLFGCMISLITMGIGLGVITYLSPLPIRTTLMILLSIPFIPLLPLSLGLGLGTIIAALSSFFRYRRLIQLLLTFTFILGMLWASSHISNGQDILQFVSIMTAKLNRIYPLSSLWLSVWNELHLPSLLMIILASSASILLTMLLASRLVPFVRLFQKPSPKRMKSKSKAHSILCHLYLLELKRYWFSQIYVVNTAIGPILMLGLAIYLRFQNYDIPGDFLNSSQLAIFILCAFNIMIGLSTTTHVSISLEGKWYWIKKSLPIPAPVYFLSKLLVNLTLTVPASVLSLILISEPLHLTISHWLFLQINIGLSCLCFPVIGLVINLWFPRLHYTNDMTVVKQSLAGFVMFGVSTALSLLPLGFLYLLQKTLPAILIAAIMQLLIGLGCLVYLKKQGAKQLLLINK